MFDNNLGVIFYIIIIVETKGVNMQLFHYCNTLLLVSQVSVSNLV